MKQPFKKLNNQNETTTLLPSKQSFLKNPSNFRVLGVLGGIFYGTNVSLAPWLPMLTHSSKNGEDSAWQVEVISSAGTCMEAAAMLVGGLLLHMSPNLSRRKSSVASSILSAVGWIAFTFSLHNASFDECYSTLVASRCVIGFGNGGLFLAIPMMITEAVSVASRGRLVVLFQLGVIVGMAFAYIAILVGGGALVSGLLSTVPAVLIFLWLVFRIPPREVQQKHVEASRQRQGEDHDRTPWKLLGIGIALAYVNNSIDPALYYGPTIFNSISNSGSGGNVAGLFSAAVSFISTSMAVYIEPLVSRRKMLLSTLGGVIISFGVLAIVFMTGVGKTSIFGKAALVLSLALSVAFNQAGPGAMFVLITNELFTSRTHRGRDISVCTFCMSGFSIAFNLSLLSTFSTVGVGETFLLYGLSFLLCWIIFYNYLPETKSNNLVSMEQPEDDTVCVECS